MDRLISENKVLEAIDNLKANFTCYDSVTLDEVASHVKAIPSAEPKTQMVDKSNFDIEQYKMDLQCAYDCGKASVEPKTGHWIIKDGKEQGYDIAGIKTWYIQIMCDKCGFIKTAIEGHTGQYHYCPNCGARMVEPTCDTCEYTTAAFNPCNACKDKSEYKRKE